jgi:prepilin-type N-terminal cleavage/methylation domain-containing protein
MDVIRQKNSTLGFTLMELMIVIAIVGIIYAIGMFSYTGAKQTIALNNAAAMLCADLKKQKQRTITCEQRCGIKITSGGYVCFEGDPITGETGRPIEFRRLLGIDVSIIQPSEGAVVDFKPEIPKTGVWASLGSSNSTIVIRSGTQTKTVTISAEGAIDLR